MSEKAKDLYAFVLQQMAAEAYLDRAQNEGVPLATVLADGNTDTRRVPAAKGYTRMPAAQAADFINKYSIVAHRANDSTGFSGTLLSWTNDQGGTEFTLSIRSTEFKPLAAGGDRERDNLSGANGEIVSSGFALGQLAALEDFYQRDVLPVVGTAKIHVTGYSLGGHLATVFTETHAPQVKVAYVFNAAGRGRFLVGGTTPERIAAMIAEFQATLVSEPNADVLTGLSSEAREKFLPLYESALQAHFADPGWNPFAPTDASSYADPRYRWAQAVVGALGSHQTGPGLPFQPGLGTAGDGLITSLYGSALNDDTTLVANSQIHPSNKIAIFIEGQPFIEGNPLDEGDFGNTHAITLIADSLALQRELERLDPNLTRAQIEAIIQSASAQKTKVVASLSDTAASEGDSLERTLMSLRKAIAGDAADDLPVSRLPGGFGDIANRQRYYEELELLPREGGFRIEVLADKSGTVIAGLAKQDDDTGLAVRYALLRLEPFAVVGGDYSTARFPNGEVQLLDSITGQGQSERWIEARARFLSAALRYNAANGDLSPVDIGAYFEDRDSGLILGSTQGSFARYIFASDEDSLPIVGLSQDDFLFGGAAADRIVGGFGDDHIEGNAGADELDGGAGDDYLAGGAGADLLIGGAGDDTLIGSDAGGGDRLQGGLGFDTFYADWGDRVADDPESSRGGIIYVGTGQVQLGEASRRKGDSYFTGAGGLKYWEGPGGEITVFDPGGGKLVIDAPAAAVPGRGVNGNLTVTGRPDLGIRLVTLDDSRPFVASADASISLWELAVSWRPFADPLALDLDGDGIETLGSLPGQAVLFDHSGDGVRDGTGWLNGDDAWLARDLDGDGLITRGAELFGVDTVLPDGSKAGNGFAALAPLDSNQDGKVDAADARFSELLLWRDANLNGVSEPFELRTLPEAGVASINLASQPANQGLPGGNVLRFAGTYRRADGTAGVAAALDLVRQTALREFAGAPEAAGAAEAPAAPGMGRVRDLQEAAAGDAGLAALVEAAAAAPSRAAQQAAARDVLSAWSGTSSMETGRDATYLRPGGPQVIYSIPFTTVRMPNEVYASFTGPIPAEQRTPEWFLSQQNAGYREQVRKLEVLEHFMGRTFTNVPANFVHTLSTAGGPVQYVQVNIDQTQLGFIEQAYAALEERTYLALAMETRLAGYVDAFMAGEHTRDFSLVEGMLESRRAIDPAGALGDLHDLARGLGAQLVDRGWINLPLMLEQWAREMRADPALAPAVEALGILPGFGETSGTGVNDVIMGSVWEKPPQAALPSVWRRAGGFGDDLLFGGDWLRTEISDGAGSDIIKPGPTTDRIFSGAGRDIILFGRGSGAPILEPQIHLPVTALDRDVLQFLPGVAPQDVIVRRVYDPFQGSYGLSLQIAGTADVFTDRYFFHTLDGGPRMLDEVRFADGTVWTLQDIRARALLGTEGSDNAAPGNPPRIMGTAYDDVLQGLAGDDVLMGDAGNDLLLGGPGQDTLEGHHGNDLLDGGPGDDRLYGGFGVDTYVLRRGGGRDEIRRGNFITFAGGDPNELDTVRVEDGISPDEVLVQWTPSGTRFLLADGSAELWDWGSPYNALYQGAGFTLPGIGRVEFGDGTVWDNTAIKGRAVQGGTDGPDVLFSYENSGDLLRGLGGDDTLRGLGGDDVLEGGSGDDVLEGDAGDDVLDGGRGDDQIAGGDGFDTARLGRDSGRDQALSVESLAIAAGISTGELSLAREGQTLRVAIAGGGEAVFGDEALQRIQFGDGTAWDKAQIRQQAAFVATSGNDAIYGYRDATNVIDALGGNDVVYGGRLNDRITGGPGNDILVGDGGADEYWFGRGDGADEISDQGGEGNVLRLRDVERGHLIRPNAFNLQIENSNDRIHLSGLGVIDRVIYADGSEDTFDALPTTYTPPAGGGSSGGSGNGGGGPVSGPFGFPIPDLYGVGEMTDGHDEIFGTNGRDILRGGKGSDLLVGRGGADIYEIHRGDGVDLIYDPRDEEGPNVLLFGPGITPQDVVMGDSPNYRYWYFVGAEDGPDAQAVFFAGGAPEVRFASAVASADGGEAGDSAPSTTTGAGIGTDGPVDVAEDPASIASRAQDAARPASRGAPDPQADAAAPALLASPAPASVGVPSDPLYREIDQRLDVLLQVGRANLSDRYAEAVREFEERRREREGVPTPPEPTEEEIGAWNDAMHAWHDQHRGFAETELGSGDGIWTLGWGLPGSEQRSLGGLSAGSSPGLANPHALRPLASLEGLNAPKDGIKVL